MGKLPLTAPKPSRSCRRAAHRVFRGGAGPAQALHRPQAAGSGAALSGDFPALRQGGQLESACAPRRGADPCLQATGGLLLAGIIENAMARTQFVRTHKLTRYGGRAGPAGAARLSGRDLNHARQHSNFFNFIICECSFPNIKVNCMTIAISDRIGCDYIQQVRHNCPTPSSTSGKPPIRPPLPSNPPVWSRRPA